MGDEDRIKRAQNDANILGLGEVDGALGALFTEYFGADVPSSSESEDDSESERETR